MIDAVKVSQEKKSLKFKNSDHAPSFNYAKALIMHHAKSFYLASKFIPKKKRYATFAIYAFCRFADNIIDKPRNRSDKQKLEELEAFRNELIIALQNGESEHPAIGPFVIAVKEYNIPFEYPLDLIAGVRMDLEINRYESFKKLYVFCYRVAAVVGLMMTYVLGFKDKNTLFYAEKLGVAMQLTNILRDIKEDSEMGRIYLPMNEMQEYDVSDDEIFESRMSDNLKELLILQVERARKYYIEAEPGIKMLDNDSAFSIVAASRIYSRILNKIEKNNYNPFLGRVFVSKTKKLKIILREYLRFKSGFANK